jgi:ATP-dependent DNA helicase DinG
MQYDQKLDESVRSQLCEAIEEAFGNEVLAIGKLDTQGIIQELSVVARGNENEVPALATYIERGDAVIHNHPSGDIRPSKPDLAIASRLGDRGVGFFIVDNEVRNVYVVAEPVLTRVLKRLDAEKLLTIVEPGGKLERTVSFYEPRRPQMDMLQSVTDGFNNDGIVVAEAGTGVGKSLAYLLPSFSWVEANDERIVISTATINLQQQLLDKDIPLVKQLLSSNKKAVLVKGRGNYICLRKLEEREEESSLFEQQDSEIQSLKQWARGSSTGSRSELTFFVDDAVWASVCSETDTCLGLRCPFREECFVLRARREAASAHILVVNHHLIFSDLSLRLAGVGFENAAVLPPFQRVIFDEAHNIEQSATSFFSESFSKYSLYKQLSRLYRRKRGRMFGLLLKLEKVAGKTEKTRKLPETIEQIREQCEQVEASISVLLGSDTTLRVAGEVQPEIKEQLLQPLIELHSVISELIVPLAAILEQIDSEEPWVYETASVVRSLESVASVCERFQRYDEYPGSVFWVERVRKKNGEQFVRINISPLHIAAIMKEALFTRYQTVVCTSATLTVRNTFTYWFRRMGLDEVSETKHVEATVFPSPFPYRNNVLLGIPQNAPLPDNDGYQEFVSRFLSELLSLSEGRGLVLFTSYRMLDQTYQDVKPLLDQQGISSLRQGMLDRAKLLHTFTTDTASVLFATASFWQGIDAPGETLKVVVICRLPFSVPTGPIIQARLEAIEKRGGNSFFELSLPEAVMKLKQGFGRLMRRQSDRGVVVILDSRIIKKSYGRFFLESLPETGRSIGEDRALLEDIETFLYPAE